MRFAFGCDGDGVPDKPRKTKISFFGSEVGVKFWRSRWKNPTRAWAGGAAIGGWPCAVKYTKLVLRGGGVYSGLGRFPE